MNTYAYFVVANISNETAKKKESIKGNPFSLNGKTKPTHRSVWESYSTQDITRVASSPIVTAFVVLCCII